MESDLINTTVDSVGMMQPYFFPYVGYYSIIDKVDVFVITDEVQYIRHGWMNRNRILNCNKEFTYINMAVKKVPQKTAIKEVRINNDHPWKQKFRQDLKRYKNFGNYYNEAMEVIEACLAYEADSLTHFHVNSLKQVMDYVGIKGRIEILSELNLQLPKIESPDEWGMYVTLALGGKTYYNPPGGMTFYDSKKYKEKGVDLLFLINKLTPYNQGRDYFIAGMSMIDLMMFLSPEEILHQVKNYEECKSTNL